MLVGWVCLDEALEFKCAYGVLVVHQALIDAFLAVADDHIKFYLIY